MELFCSKKKWIVNDYPYEEIQRLCRKTGLTKVGARLLLKRGLSDETEALRFLTVSDTGLLYDPMLLKDMDRAVERINSAIEEGQSICIYGDYDVDGITATAVLYKYLSARNANVRYYIPKRLTEGYGMNCNAVKELADSGVNLIVTVDNGITANDEINYARTLGVDVVVTDHHECREEIPECCAVVNPQRPDCNYPFKGLAGVGVAFKLVCALEGSFQNRDFTAFADKYIDLTALGTISDVMPLIDENRAIVARGLKCFANGSNFGISALIAEANGIGTKRRYTDKNITSTTVGFLVAPRLNAAGRIGDVNTAVEILISRDFENCLNLADELCRKNRERQAIENGIFECAVRLVEEQVDLKKDKVIVLACEGWHHGVVGIVASRITEKYSLPSILISCENGIGKGSARSIKGFNINQAIHDCRELLIRHGGHELAAGLTLELDKIDAFREKINEIAKTRITEDILEGSIEVDAELTGEDISLEVCEELLQFEPFGSQNPTPVFCMRDAVVRDIISLGQNKHTKLILEQDGYAFEALLFGVCPDNFLLMPNRNMDLLFNLDINEFRGEKTPQLIVREIALCNDDSLIAKEAEEICRDILAGNRPADFPSLEKFRIAYKYLRDNEALLSGNVNVMLLSIKLSFALRYKIYPVELAVILKVLENAGLCEIRDLGELVMHIRLLKTEGKTDLEANSLYRKAKGIQ